jgi:hypothetical protein
MKHLFLLSILFLFHEVLSQTELEKKLNEDIWGNAAPEFRATSVPARWVNESAVILASSVDYEYKRGYQIGSERVILHFRIKLQDKASVNEFSELSFDKNMSNKANLKSTSYYVVGLKVIKANGAENILDLSQAVKADAGSSKDLKIAVPDLEPGDILDYYTAIKKEGGPPNFTENEIIEDKYPVVKKTIRFKLPESVYCKSFSYNGAPELKHEYGKDFNLITFEDTMRSKAPDLIWNFSHRTSPEIRYNIYSNLTTSNKQESVAVDVLKNFNLYFPPDIGFMLDFMNGNFKDEKDPVKIVNEMFHLLRNPIYLKAYFNIEQGNPMAVNDIPESFAQIVNKFLVYKKIEHEVMIVPTRTYGTFEELVSLNSCEYIIKVNTVPPMYISKPSPFALVNEIPDTQEGMPAISKVFAGPDNRIRDTLSISLKGENMTLSKVDLTLDKDDNSRINVRRSVLAKGHNKAYHQYMVFTNYDYLKEYDLPKYQVQRSHLFRDLIKQYNIEKQKFEQRLKQDYEARDARIKKDLETEIDVEVFDYKNLSVKSIGMWDHARDIEYSDEYALGNLTKKAGANLIIEIGRLIEKQSHVKDEQRVRTRDVFMNFPRAFNFEISFNIPDGYVVEGFEKLNKKIENEHGGFVSSATINGKTLIVKSSKYYNKNYCPASDWPKILEFLDAAVEFQKEKILLKKQ